MKKSRPFREHLIFFCRKLGGWCFLLMLVTGVLSNFVPFIKPVFPVGLLLLSMVAFSLMFLPSEWKKANGVEILFFFSMLGVSCGFATLVARAALHMPLRGNSFTNYTGLVIFLSILGVFIAMLAEGGSEPASKSEIKDAFKKTAEGLKLSVTDTGGKTGIHLKAQGSHAGGTISLEMSRNKKGGTPASVITFTPSHPPPCKTHILCTRRIVKITGTDETRAPGLAEKVAALINDKGLEEFDFNLVTTDEGSTSQVAVAIEEEDLWKDYIALCRMAAGA